MMMRCKCGRKVFRQFAKGDCKILITCFTREKKDEGRERNLSLLEIRVTSF